MNNKAAQQLEDNDRIFKMALCKLHSVYNNYIVLDFMNLYDNNIPYYLASTQDEFDSVYVDMNNSVHANRTILLPKLLQYFLNEDIFSAVV